MNDFQKIKRLINCIKGSKISVELKDIERIVIEIDGWIILEPIEVEIEARSIKGGIKRKAMRWNVQMLSSFNGDPDCPPDVDITDVASKLTLDDACIKALEILVASRVESALMDIEYDEMIEQEKEYSEYVKI